MAQAFCEPGTPESLKTLASSYLGKIAQVENKP